MTCTNIWLSKKSPRRPNPITPSRAFISTAQQSSIWRGELEITDLNRLISRKVGSMSKAWVTSCRPHRAQTRRRIITQAVVLCLKDATELNFKGQQIEAWVRSTTRRVARVPAIQMKTNPVPQIAVIVPCYNEAKTIAGVIDDFRAALPDAAFYVFDNNSSDNTSAVAAAAGAHVRAVAHQGKGNVVRRMFADVEADVYVMVDGDRTYDANVAPTLIETLVSNGLDMVVGSRVTDEKAAYRPGHRLGNAILTGFAALIFGGTFKDMLSGYRVFSRRYAKSFPAHACGFETETELAVHALELRMPVAEIDTVYGARPEGSVSKLNTYRDGVRILWTILRLFKLERPLAFFSIGFVACLLLSVALSAPLFETYLETGLVPRLPTAVLSAAFALLGFIFLTCGLVLDTVTKGRIEAKRFAYLSIPVLNRVAQRN